MPILTIIWSALTSRLGGWLIGGLTVLALVGLWKWEHAAKIRAETKAAMAEQGMKIGYEAYAKLYQEREKIKDQAAAQRRKINELEKTNDLSEYFNAPGGVRRGRPANPPGGPQRPTTYYDPAAPGAQYQEAP